MVNNEVKTYIDNICTGILRENGLQLAVGKDGKEAIVTERNGFVAYLPWDECPNVLTTATRIVNVADAFNPDTFPVIAAKFNPNANRERMATAGVRYKTLLVGAADRICEELGLTRIDNSASLDQRIGDWLANAVPYSSPVSIVAVFTKTFRDLERNFKLGTFSDSIGGELVATEFLSRARKEPSPDFVLAECIDLAEEWIRKRGENNGT